MAPNGRPRVILDCDPGLDDAIALALALRHADVLGVTTVGGNAALEHTTANALALCDLLGRPDVPVHAGRADPLAGPRRARADSFHGPRGTGNATLGEPSRPPTSRDAVGWIVETVRAEPGCWLVATGPLSNVAAALQAAPDVAGGLAGISWMGGSAANGNVTPAAEFNAWVDPEAAAAVFAAGVPELSMAGLDVTLTVLLDRPYLEALASATAGRPAAVLADLLRYYEERQRETTTLDGTPVHDALAVVRVTHPALVTGERWPVEVVTASGPTRGMTLVDRRPLRSPPPATCRVLEHADAPAIRALIGDALTS